MQDLLMRLRELDALRDDPDEYQVDRISVRSLLHRAPQMASEATLRIDASSSTFRNGQNTNVYFPAATDASAAWTRR